MLSNRPCSEGGRAVTARRLNDMRLSRNVAPTARDMARAPAHRSLARRGRHDGPLGGHAASHCVGRAEHAAAGQHLALLGWGGRSVGDRGTAEYRLREWGERGGNWGGRLRRHRWLERASFDQRVRSGRRRAGRAAVTGKNAADPFSFLPPPPLLPLFSLGPEFSGFAGDCKFSTEVFSLHFCSGLAIGCLLSGPCRRG